MSPRQFWACVVVGGVVTVVASFVALSIPYQPRGRGSTRTEAIINAKQMGLAMLEFEQEYRSFPSDKTVAEVIKRTGSTLDFSDGSSNAMFRQLIAYGIQSEDIFYAWHPEGTVQPDNDMFGRDALEAKEVGFSYVMGLDTTMDPATPVLMTPMRTASRDQFWRDGKRYKDKAVILRLDTSAEAPLIRPSDDKVVDARGVPILDAAQPCFGGKWPDIRHPKMAP